MKDGEKPEQSPAQVDRLVALRVRHRRIVHGADDCAETHTVGCPQQGRSQTLEHCTGCPRFQALSVEDAGTVLQCWVELGRVSPAPGAVLTLQESFEQTPVAEVALATCTCLDPELEAAEAAQILEADRLSSAPVVDDGGVLLGMVETRALQSVCLAESYRHDLEPGSAAEVEDAMSASADVIALGERASIADAARLMACSGLDRLPIVTGTAQVVGTVTAMDLVNWLARRRGGPF